MSELSTAIPIGGRNCPLPVPVVPHLNENWYVSALATAMVLAKNTKHKTAAVIVVNFFNCYTIKLISFQPIQYSKDYLNDYGKTPVFFHMIVSELGTIY